MRKAISSSVGQIILRWLNQRNVIVIPKTVRRERMAMIADLDTDRMDIIPFDRIEAFFRKYLVK